MLLPARSPPTAARPSPTPSRRSLGSGAATFVAVIAAISAFGACNALILLSAEVGRSLASANDLPPLFRRANAAGAPTGSLLVGASIATLLVLASSSESFVEVYKFIALVSTVASLVLYTVCSTAALTPRRDGPWLIVAGPRARLLAADVRRRRAGSDAVGPRRCLPRRASDPLAQPALRDQPGGGDCSGRACGNKPPQLLGEAAQAHFARSQRPGNIGRRSPSPPARARSARCPRH